MARGLRAHTNAHMQQESVIVWKSSVDVGVDLKYGKQRTVGASETRELRSRRAAVELNEEKRLWHRAAVFTDL